MTAADISATPAGPLMRAVMRFAWYGRLSTKDKQDPTISFPSQREACEGKAAELGGRIVCDFTDQETGRRDDREAWSELVREARDRDARRFDGVVIYSTSRLSRDLFHALAFEREPARAGVQVYYTIAAGDQTSPEGRLMRHMFQALDQFEVEKLGREVRRGQTENTKQGYRNGGRAPYGYKLHREAHPDPRRARAGDQKSRLAPDPEQAPVIVDIFERYVGGQGFKEIANYLNRPGGPKPPQHVDSRRNTAGKWAKTTIRAILENPVYTGRLYWNRLDFRQIKTGEGPLIRRPTDEWIEAERRHEALIPDEWFAQTQTNMTARRVAQSNPRQRPQHRFYLLRGSLLCATGHNPLRMQGKTVKGYTYYACGYRSDYGDKAAEALGHGKWQYIREDRLTSLVDQFFATNIFGPNRLHHLRAQHASLATAIEEDKTTQQRTRLTDQLADIDQRIGRQLAAIEAGVEPVLVGERILTLKAERHQAEAALSQLDLQQRQRAGIDLQHACAILDGLPDLAKPLAKADPELQRRIFEIFHLRVELDRNTPQVRMKALVSSAFNEADDLGDLAATVTDKAIAGAVCGCRT
jgi:DNA invertase Pin-like site-specific DNA recombinase